MPASDRISVCREAAVEIQSSVPWIGFPVAYAVSSILLTIFGYFAMIPIDQISRSRRSQPRNSGHFH
jgi:hypothetical protein